MEEAIRPAGVRLDRSFGHLNGGSAVELALGPAIAAARLRDPRFVGILPAAGAGSRLGTFRYPKELLPVLYVQDDGGGEARPVPVAEYSLRAMRMAEIKHCLIVISDSKTDILRYFGDGSGIEMRIAYLHRAQPRGLADAVESAYEWLIDNDSHVCLALPDTVFRPVTALAQIRERILATGADVVLGVFPTSQPQLLGPVRTDSRGRVIEVLEKPAETDLYNTWGVAVWSPHFTSFLHQFLACTPPPEGRTELSVSEAFNAAVEAGLDVQAVVFDGGSYLDIGTAKGIASLLVEDEVGW